jgi:hypothetical protein
MNMDENKTITYKQIASVLGVGRITAWKIATNTRLYYGKKAGEKITFGQVLTANNLRP